VSKESGKEAGNEMRRKVQLDSFLPYRINITAERISKALSGIYSKQFGLSVSEWRVVAFLGERGLLSAKDICELTLMDKTKVSRAVNSLDSKSLVIQETSQEDNRLRHLKLTAEGKRLYARLVPLALSWESLLLEDIPAQDFDTFMRVINRLNEKLDSI